MIGVYTALFGNYDTLQPTPYNGIVFTDQALKVDGWHTERVELPHDNPRYASRYYFDQSCLVMPEFFYTVMHGGNATLKVHPAELVELLPSGIDIGCLQHWQRQTVEAEAQACIRMHKDKRETIEAQMERYKDEGFSLDTRLSACILLVRRQTSRLREFETMWWNEVSSGSYRDQLSFDYCRWKLNFPVFYLPGSLRDYLVVGKHNG